MPTGTATTTALIVGFTASITSPLETSLSSARAQTSISGHEQGLAELVRRSIGRKMHCAGMSTGLLQVSRTADQQPPTRSLTAASGRRTYAKDRVLPCDRLELAERRPPVDGEVCARATCHLEVPP